MPKFSRFNNGFFITRSFCIVGRFENGSGTEARSCLATKSLNSKVPMWLGYLGTYARSRRVMIVGWSSEVAWCFCGVVAWIGVLCEFAQRMVFCSLNELSCVVLISIWCYTRKKKI